MNPELTLYVASCGAAGHRRDQPLPPFARFSRSRSANWSGCSTRPSKTGSEAARIPPSARLRARRSKLWNGTASQTAFTSPRLPGNIARCFGDAASRTRVNLTDRLPTVQDAPPTSRSSEHSPDRSRDSTVDLTGYEDITRRMPLPRTPPVIRLGGLAPCIAAVHPSWAPAAFEPLRPLCYTRHWSDQRYWLLSLIGNRF